MFESLKSWFDSLETEGKLFNHPDEEAIHVAVASLLYHIINADDLESAKEKHKFTVIMSEEFGLTDKQISTLYRYVKTLKSDLTTDLNTVNEYLKDNPNLRMALMNKLNQLIGVDGVKSNELQIFYDAIKVIFPDLVDEDSTF